MFSRFSRRRYSLLINRTNVERRYALTLNDSHNSRKLGLLLQKFRKMMENNWNHASLLYVTLALTNVDCCFKFKRRRTASKHFALNTISNDCFQCCVILFTKWRWHLGKINKLLRHMIRKIFVEDEELTSCAGNWFADHNEWPNEFFFESVYHWIEITKKW